jgi:type II secretory pathway pseudopilin PulG
MSIATKQRAAEAAQAELNAAIENARRAAADLKKAQDARAAEPRPGSKVLITATFPSSDQEYTYLALRTDNPRQDGANWYVTGQKGKITWDDVLRLVERGTYTIQYMSFSRP